jgi:hypothetical protein
LFTPSHIRLRFASGLRSFLIYFSGVNLLFSIVTIGSYAPVLAFGDDISMPPTTSVESHTAVFDISTRDQQTQWISTLYNPIFAIRDHPEKCFTIPPTVFKIQRDISTIHLTQTDWLRNCLDT